jgi:hypothetical protein
MSLFNFLLFLLIFNQYINSYNLRKLCSTENECLQIKKNIINILIIVLSSLVIFIIIIVIYIKCCYRKNINSKIQKDLLKKNYLFQKIMPIYIYNQNNQNECVICLQKFIINYSKICKTPCKHIFHFYCLKKFILSTKNIECPLCKYNFNKHVQKIKDKELLKIKIIPLNENDNPEKEYHLIDKLVINLNKIYANSDKMIQNDSIQITDNNRININEQINPEIIKINRTEEKAGNIIKTLEQKNHQIEQNEDETNRNLRN